MTDEKITALIARATKIVSGFAHDGMVAEHDAVYLVAAALDASVQAPAVDREAAIGVLTANQSSCGDSALIGNKYLAGRVVDTLLASGILHDAAEVEANALEKAAEKWLHGAWGDTPRRSDRIADRMAASQFAGDWLKARAQQVREGKQ